MLIHSVIDAVPSPTSLLARMGGARGLVRKRGGIIVVVSAYDWKEEVTPRGAWLGGYLDDKGIQVSRPQKALQNVPYFTARVGKLPPVGGYPEHLRSNSFLDWSYELA